MQNSYPEPLLTANLYSPGRLDHAVVEVLKPFWHSVRSSQPDFPGHLWFQRHNARSEHVKIRLHGPEEVKERLRRDLARRVEMGVDAPKVDAAEVTPGVAIDPEDRSTTPPDAALQWTSYGRHPVVFGGLPRDEAFTTLFSECLGRTSELVLELSRIDLDDLHSYRQNVLIRLVGLGLARALPTLEERAGYLTFHRDWLVRYPVLWSGYGPAKAREVLEIYRKETAKIPTAALSGLGDLLVQEPDAFGEQQALAAAFTQAIDRLSDLLLQSDEPVPTGDPFAPGPLHPALFKIFHLAANQLGIVKMEEGFSHHLLASAMGADQGEGFVLAPLLTREHANGSSRAFTPKVAAFEENYAWTVYALAGCDDPPWASCFREVGEGIVADCGRALRMLRANDLDRGRNLLDDVEPVWRGLAGEHPSLFEALGRFFYGTLSYLHYLEGEDETALAVLEQAGASVATAIALDRFLTPMAPLVVDIPLQRARVARRLGQWQEMEDQLLRLRDLQLGRRPLCQLGDGQELGYPELARYFADLDLGHVEEKYRIAVTELLDPKLRLGEFMRRYAELYAPRHKLAPYP